MNADSTFRLEEMQEGESVQEIPDHLLKDTVVKIVKVASSKKQDKDLGQELQRKIFNVKVGQCMWIFRPTLDDSGKPTSLISTINALSNGYYRVVTASGSEYLLKIELPGTERLEPLREGFWSRCKKALGIGEAENDPF